MEIHGHIDNTTYVPDYATCTAYEYLKEVPKNSLPASVIKGVREVSNSELRRWLETSSVVINGQTPKPNDTVRLPITELVFFPSGKRKATLV